MLRANVGLSRKVSRDFQSTGYTVNIEGEILSPPGDHEGVLGRVQELFSLAEAALQTEFERDQSEQAIGRRDEEPPARQPVQAPTPPERPSRPPHPSQPSQPTNHPPRNGHVEPATPKQVGFIEQLAKRQKLSFSQLGSVIQDALGQSKSLQQLTKKEAGAVIESLNGGGSTRNGQ